MSTSLVHVDPLCNRHSIAQSQVILSQMVLDSVQSSHSKRNYAHQMTRFRKIRFSALLSLSRRHSTY
jgi:hypothetical protein